MRQKFTYQKIKALSLIFFGAFLGALMSFAFTAHADRVLLENEMLPLQELRQFTDAFAMIKSHYVEKVEDTKLVSGAISGMLSNLDPHSSYLDAEAFKGLQTDTSGEFVGIGIEVVPEDGFVKVVSPMQDSPAFLAGIKAGDLIIKIDQRTTRGMSLREAIKLMRGKPNTPLQLTLMRKNYPKPIVLDLLRKVIAVQSVTSKILEAEIAYIRIAQFQEHTAENLVKHLNRLLKNGEIKGLILDLRNDPGGLLHSAVRVAAAFLGPGMLVASTDGREEEARQEYTTDLRDNAEISNIFDRLPALAKTIPLVVIVNAGSASASEIVAGALQDHRRAVILGTKTFGKGSVQSILPLSSKTAIKLTTARYFTPSGRSIQATGITPDYLVPEFSAGQKTADLLSFREEDLSRHLLNQDKAASLAKEANPYSFVEGRKDFPPDCDCPDELVKKLKPDLEMPKKPLRDYQLEQAQNFLKGKKVVTSTEKFVTTY